MMLSETLPGLNLAPEPVIIRDEWQQYLDFRRHYFEMRIRVLQTELNWIRHVLGENPKRCPQCGKELK